MANVSIDISNITKYDDVQSYSDVKIDKTMTNVLVDKQSIRNCVTNILKWKQGERILFPEFGNAAYNYLFENITSESFSTIKSSISNMLSAEPRIKVQEIQINTDIDMNEIKIMVSYEIPAIEESDSVVLVISS